MTNLTNLHATVLCPDCATNESDILCLSCHTRINSDEEADLCYEVPHIMDVPSDDIPSIVVPEPINTRCRYCDEHITGKEEDVVIEQGVKSFYKFSAEYVHIDCAFEHFQLSAEDACTCKICLPF